VQPDDMAGEGNQLASVSFEARSIGVLQEGRAERPFSFVYGEL